MAQDSSTFNQPLEHRNPVPVDTEITVERASLGIFGLYQGALGQLSADISLALNTEQAAAVSAALLRPAGSCLR